MTARPPAPEALAYRFAPDPLGAAELDLGVRLGLGQSLRTIFDSLDAPSGVDRRRIEALVHSIEAGPVQPWLFGAYVDLVMALFEDRPSDAQARVEELLSAAPTASRELRVVTLDDRELGYGQSARYRRLVNDDVPFVIDPVRGQARATATALVGEACELLREGAPAVFGEIKALIRQIVLVAGQPGPDGMVIEGASTFSLWGALFLNANRLADRLTTAVALAHEAGHSHLFGLARGGRLVDNDDEERRSSPLRKDARPLDGVAHAAYVSARMAYALNALLASGRLDEAETIRAREGVIRNRRACAEGLETVLAHGRFTAHGAGAFEQLRLHLKDLL